MEEKEVDKKTDIISETKIQQNLNKSDVRNVKKWKKIMHLIFLIVSVMVGIKYCKKISWFDEFLYNEFVLYIIALLITFFELEIVYNILIWIKNRKIKKGNLIILLYAMIIVICTYVTPVGIRKITWKVYEVHNFATIKQQRNLCNIYNDTMEEGKIERINHYYTEDCHCGRGLSIDDLSIDPMIAEKKDDNENIPKCIERIFKKISILNICIIIYNLIEVFFSKKNKKINYILLIKCFVVMIFIYNFLDQYSLEKFLDFIFS